MAEGIFFTSPAHKERFVTAMQEIGKIYDGRYDSEYGAAIYILTSSSNTWSKAQGYIKHNGIDIEKMLEEQDWSGGLRRLVKLAGSLFNGQIQVDLSDVINSLDGGNFKVMISSILIRRRGLRVDNLSLVDKLSLPD